MRELNVNGSSAPRIFVNGTQLKGDLILDSTVAYSWNSNKVFVSNRKSFSGGPDPYGYLIHKFYPDLSIIESGTHPSESKMGIGGIERRLYCSDSINNKIWEYDPDTMLNLSGTGVSAPANYVFSVGGTETKLFCITTTDDKIYELDPDTLSNISGSGWSVPVGYARGIGGINNRLYISDNSRLYELDTSTLTILSGPTVFPSPLTGAEGIGGVNAKLYACQFDYIVEIDPDTFLNVNQLTGFMDEYRDIGGTK